MAAPNETKTTDEDRLSELLAKRDPWALLDELARDWSPALATACEARLATSDAEGSKRLVWLLERARQSSAIDVLLRRLPRANDQEAAAILRALNTAGARVPPAEIRRLLVVAAEEAVVAAGRAEEASLVPSLVERLDDPVLGWHAALSLARLGRRELASAIADRIPHAKGLQAVGLLVALEAMNEPSVALRLRALLVQGAPDLAWDLHHAVWRLTGREPLVPLVTRREDGARAYAEAWRTFDVEALPRPRRDPLTFVDGWMATVERHDGSGRLRVDYDPVEGGGHWPRWALSLYVGDRRLYAIGSHCGTCETTLRLLGHSPERAVADASTLRANVKDVRALDAGIIDALEPYFAAMRTGHYTVHLVDLPLERVSAPERSWLARRAALRVSDDDSDSAPDVHADQWLGTEHFQTPKLPASEVPTFCIVVPTAPLDSLDASTVNAYVDGLASGARPAPILLAWAETKDVRGEHPERFVVGAVLDGHHKLAAYARAEVPARCLVVSRLEDTWGPGEDRGGPLRDALGQLGRPVRPPSVTKTEVAERLETILPGLRRYAAERAADAYARRQWLWQRRHPGRPPLGKPHGTETNALNPDSILEHAAARGAHVERVTIDRLAVPDEEVFVVSDDEVCERVPASRLAELVANYLTTVNDGSFEGDALFVCTLTPRVIVVHHEGHVFDIEVGQRCSPAHC